MRILCVGDVVGKPGRLAVQNLLPKLIDQHQIDIVITNCENAAGGMGLTIKTAKELLSQPIHILTSGNHIWRHKEIIDFMDREQRLLRPFNFPAQTPGRGYAICESASGIKVGVINLLGRTFMEPISSPFETVLDAIEKLKEKTKIIVVDIHAEATSEKRAMGWFLDGKVSAVYGTHTHVPTADEQILPKGTGYVTDIGMTGPYDSVLGMKTETVLERFLTLRPNNFTVAKHDIRLCGIIFEVNPDNGCTLSIKRINEPLTR